MQELDTQLDSHVAAELMRSVRQKQLFSGLLSRGMLHVRAVARTYSERPSIFHCIQLDAAQGRRPSYEVKAVMLTASLCPLTAA